MESSDKTETENLFSYSRCRKLLGCGQSTFRLVWAAPVLWPATLGSEAPFLSLLE